jgi:beta-glucosidase
MSGTGAPQPFHNPDLPIDKRVDDVVSRLTLDEKIGQLVHDAPAVPRLGIPAYNWWNECLHGVARAGMATVFPQAIGLAATFHTALVRRVAVAISDEARAKHHQALRQGGGGQYFGLTFWSPNVNIFRDPRWGRGQETYGEDPYLTASMAVAFVKGLQGDDPRYLKAIATPKHFAVHSGREADRHRFDAVVSQRDLRETYLPAFWACVREAKAASIMAAYNCVNGEPCCASPTLLQKILREEWGFDGYVVSDCDAVYDIHAGHRATRGPSESVATALSSGCDLNCGQSYRALRQALGRALVDEAAINRAVKRLFRARFMLGMFDPPDRVPHAAVSPAVVGSLEHRALSLHAARESIVLLKNDGDLLPLDKETRSLAVVGPNAESLAALLGNYTGYPRSYITPLMGILDAVSVGTQVQYTRGCTWTGGSGGVRAAVNAAQQADVVIAVMGLTAQMEGEEGAAPQSEDRGDRVHLGLPEVQEELLRELHATGTPVVLVLMSGGPLTVNWADRELPAILQAWYPGQEGGRAIADVLFGDVSPAGRMPVTCVRSLDQLPLFGSYDMAGRTYRFMEEEPLYRFGYGLGYTTFEYSNLRLSDTTVTRERGVKLLVDVTNTGERPGDEVAQVYVKALSPSVPAPLLSLQGFRRARLWPGEKRTVAFSLLPRQFALYDDDGRPFMDSCRFALFVGGGQPDDPTSGCLEAAVAVHE